MYTHLVVVRTPTWTHFRAIDATSSAEAAEVAATEFANVPCGITVKGEVRG